MVLHMPHPYVNIRMAQYIYYVSFNTLEWFKMHCNVSQWFTTHLQRFLWMRATLSNDEEWFYNVVQRIGIGNVSKWNDSKFR